MAKTRLEKCDNSLKLVGKSVYLLPDNIENHVEKKD